MTTALCNEAHRWGSRPTLSLLHAVAASLVARLPARLVALRRHVVEAIGNLTNLRKLDLRSFTAAGGADEARRERVRKAAREGATVMF